MIKFLELPSQKYLIECFDYNKETGIFIWKHRPLEHFNCSRGYNMWNTKYANKKAGGKKEKYLLVGINGKEYLLHRLAFKIVTGNDPLEQIDHTDKNKLNNAFSNLRQASHSENLCNMKKHVDNKCGLKGVTFNKKRNRYVAEIMINRKRYRKSGFLTKEAAHEHYCNLSKQLHNEFSNFGEL